MSARKALAMLNPITPKRKLAAATDHGELNFVLTTTPRPQQRNTINEFLHDDDARV